MNKRFYLILSFFIFHFHMLNGQDNNAIRMNQLGFYTHGPKKAIVTGNVRDTSFYVVSAKKADTVFRGSLSKKFQSSNSSTVTRVAEFSAFDKVGTYQLGVPGAGISYVFSIGPNVHHAVAVSSLKGFYYQRSSMPLDRLYAGKWFRAAGHPDTSVLIHPSAVSPKRLAGTVISAPGGWYDAGDYNKYIVNSGISMATLLSAYEDFPAYFDTLKTNIPESEDAIPDILNEAIYNLRWMLTMQDADDGGVYNKCTNAAFDGMVMPGVTKAPRYVVAKGTAATLDFAAVMAQSSRIASKYSKQLPGLADSCLVAAVKAWKWALQNPELPYDQSAINTIYEPKITTGAYGDRNFKDEWFWAAVELFATTKDVSYQTVLAEKINDAILLPSWANVYMLGCYTLIRMEKSLPAINGQIASLKKRFLQFADDYTQHVSDNAFQTVMGQSKKDFNWGSNSNAANEGIVLIYAYLMTKNKKYISYSLTNLDYILGRNATGYCFVTGIGSKSSMHPHHRQSVSDGVVEPVPGLLVGGANPGMQDHEHYEFVEPETAYVDVDGAYASNEIAINWNAPLVYLANAIEALQREVTY